MELDPADVTLPAGPIRFDVSNEGPTPHNVAIRQGEGELLATTPDLGRDEAGILDAMLEPGDYILFCTLPGHESLGVVGTLTVTP